MAAPLEAREEIIVVGGDEGAASMELMPLGEGVARGFLRFSPRNPKLSEGAADEFSEKLAARGFSRILVGDSKKGLLKRVLGRRGWMVERAIPKTADPRARSATTYEIPLDEMLVDAKGDRIDLSGTGRMSGVRVALGDRTGWAFYAEEGTVARVIPEAGGKQGFLAASTTEDMFVVADALVKHLSSLGMTIAVFSTDLGRFIRKFEPTTMWRMTLDRPRGFDHSCKPLSSHNKRMATRLFSEYYDESTVQSMLRMRKFKSEGSYSTYLLDGGFVITRIDGDVGLIYDIYVTPSRQGEGLGEELMRGALSSMSGRVTSVYLHTSYPRAKRMYEKFGFTVALTQLGVWLYEASLTHKTAR